MLRFLNFAVHASRSDAQRGNAYDLVTTLRVGMHTAMPVSRVPKLCVGSPATALAFFPRSHALRGNAYRTRLNLK